MRHGSLFSGIGGFDLASEWMGWENVFHCEWNPFGQKVLKHYWPNAESFDDITKTDFTKYANQIDILTGGFPCQPYSMAGKRKGKEDERHLWPEMLRAIREIKPKYIVGENVFGLTNWNGGMVFDEVHSDLEFEGYEVQAVVIPAAAVNAPHGRDRVWFVATNTKNGRCGRRLCKQCSTREWELFSDKQRWSEMGCKIERCSGIGDATYTECDGLEYGNETRNIRGKEATPCGERSQFTNVVETDGKNDNVTNSNCDGFDQCNGNDEINTSERGQYAQRDAESCNGNGDATDTSRIGFQCERESTRMERGRFSFNNTQKNKSNWDNFPTQSPICGGDDGLPTELDGITFSKWRNESIKAYGNAIVPQVAYEIFKAIERTI